MKAIYKPKSGFAATLPPKAVTILGFVYGDYEPPYWKTGSMKCTMAIVAFDDGSIIESELSSLQYVGASVIPSTASPWISVTERLPKLPSGYSCVAVIVAQIGEDQGEKAVFCDDGTFRFNYRDDPITEVTHWMPPIPTPHAQLGRIEDI